MNRQLIGSTLDWYVMNANVPRITSVLPHPVHPRNLHPNAYSAVLGVIQASHKGYALTIDQSILDMRREYNFIQVPNLDQGVYRVEVHRTADDLPEIYRWFQNHHVDFSAITQVPWVHPAHTVATWGFCPYCEDWLTHENWQQHRYAECLGQGRHDHEYVAFPADFDKRSVSKSSMEPLNMERGILRLFRWKKLMKTASGSYVCWENSFSENTAIRSIPTLYVYGSQPNQIHFRKGRSKREEILVGEPIEAGTIIIVSPLRQSKEELHYWGRI